LEWRLGKKFGKRMPGGDERSDGGRGRGGCEKAWLGELGTGQKLFTKGFASLLWVSIGKENRRDTWRGERVLSGITLGVSATSGEISEARA